jgi:hypothetical protein
LTTEQTLINVYVGQESLLPLQHLGVSEVFGATEPRKQFGRLLKFAHDNQWPLQISVVFAISEISTLQITYNVSWEGLIILHLLGLAPAGYLAAPDNGHEAGCAVVHVKYP